MQSLDAYGHSRPCAPSAVSGRPRAMSCVAVEGSSARRCVLCAAQPDSRPSAIVSASPVAMDRVQTGNEVPPAETDLSFLPCPRQGIRNNATELIGFTPMVRSAMGLAARPQTSLYSVGCRRRQPLPTCCACCRCI